MKSAKTILSLLLIVLPIFGFIGCDSTSNRSGTDSVTSVREESAPDTATLVFFGDAMQHGMQLERARELGSPSNPYNFDGCFELIAPAVKDADYAVVNLELPLGGGPDYSGYPMFSAPDSYAMALKNAGFDLFLTANNHCLDRKDAGLRRTLTVLDSLKVDHIGTYNDASERGRLVPFIKEINGIKIGFLNYTYGTNGMTAGSGAEVSYINREKIKNEIEATRKAGAEIIVAMPHWGVEYVLNENDEQRSLADFMLKQGVDIIIGGHPHVVQPMRVITDSDSGKKSLVVYSLGNFISNMTARNTRGGAFVRVVIERDAEGNARFKNAEYDTFITETPTGENTNFRVVPRWAVHLLPESQKDNWSQHDRAVTELYTQYNIEVPRSGKSY